MSFAFQVIGAGVAIARLTEIGRRATGAVPEGVEQAVAEGTLVVQRHASGRPGPNVITDAFRSGISWAVIDSYPVVTGVIYSRARQARRLEFGFYGADSLGRVYAQPPYPSFQPSIPEVTEIANRILGRKLTSIVG